MASPFDAAFSDPEGPEANPTQTAFTLPDVEVTPNQDANTAGRGGTSDPGTGNAVEPLVRGGGVEAFDLSGSSARPAPGGTQVADLDPTAETVARKWLAAGYTPEQTAGALGVIGGAEAPGFNSKAQNPNSGATGLYQHLGPRLFGPGSLQDHLEKTGSDWFDPGAQTDYALRELRGDGTASDERRADQYIRGSKTPEETAQNYAKHFMRPGPGYGPEYRQRITAMAKSVYPDVQKLAASLQNPQVAQGPAVSSTDAGGTPATPVNYQELSQGWGEEADHPAHQPLPPGTSSGAVKGSAGYYANMVKGWDDEEKPTAPWPGSAPPAPGVLQQLGHAASYLPAMAWRAAAASIGWRADALNAVKDAQEWAMRKVGLNPKPAPNIEDSSYLPTPTTANVASLGGMITPPKLPSEVGDTDSIARYLETFGMPALQVAAMGMPRATIGALAAGGGVPKVIGSVAKETGKNAALGAGIFGLGDDLGQHISGSPGGTPEAQSWGTGVSLGMEAARLALFKGGSLAAGASPGIFDKYIRGKVGPGPNLRENISDPAMAGANLRAYDPNSAVPGFQTTGAAASGDNGAQALFNMHRHTSAQVEGRFNDILKNNSNAIDNASEGVIPGSGGVPQHALDYFRNELESDRDAMEQRVNDAGQEAKARFDTVIRDTGVGEDHVLAREALGNSQHDALWEADKNLKSHADWRWDNARKAGIMELPIADADAATTLHGPLQAAMAEAIRGGQAEHFPWDAVKGLYKGDPRNLFDGEGNVAPTRKAAVTIGPSGEPVMGPTPGPQSNPKGGLTIGTVREIQSDLEADVRQERKAVTSPFVQGDPKALRWQSRVLGILNDAMDHTLENSGGGNNATYRLATAATANRYKLMNQGVVGQILGRNLQGGDGSIASPQTLEKLVPGGTGGAAATRQLFSVIDAQRNQQAGLDPHTGQPAPGAPIGQPAPPAQHPADILHQNLENQLRLDFGQNMRDGGPEHGQQWLENHSVALDAFPGLKTDMQNAISSGADYKGLQKQQPQFDKQQGQDAANLFLGGDAGKEIDYVTRSGKPVEAMNGLLDRGAGDHTGRANPGIARMFFDRMRSEAVDPITHDYNPGGVARFWDAHKDTFGALADHGLINRQALGQIVGSFKELDKMHANPGATLTTPESAKISLPYLADKAFRVAGAAIGREAHSGTIQVPGITADIASKIGGQLFSKLSAAGAKNLQADLLFEPGRLQQFLEAGTVASQGKGTSLMEKLLSPYMRAAPAVAAAQMNKQTGPQTQPDATGLVAPNSTNTGW